MHHRSPGSAVIPAACRIVGHAILESPLSEIPAWRNRPAPADGPPLPPRFLRHADEHTVMGVHAVLAALAAAPQADRSGHAVVAAPCQAGRLAAARTLALLSSGGAVTVSPHIVPQCSLHSIAGAVSVALGMHGPHLGVGGGPDALAEGLFAAATLVGSVGSACPAAWLVVTDWDEEPDLDETGESRGDPVCRALALLLLPGGSPDGGGEESSSISLAVRLPHEPLPGPPAQATSGGLLAFARGLEICAAGAALAAWTVTSRWGGEIRLSRQPAGIRLREAA